MLFNETADELISIRLLRRNRSRASYYLRLSNNSKYISETRSEITIETSRIADFARLRCNLNSGNLRIFDSERVLLRSLRARVKRGSFPKCIMAYLYIMHILSASLQQNLHS